MRKTKPILIALLCLPLTACFEEPVQEHLHLTIQADGLVIATVVQQLAPSDRAHDNTELAEQLEESRACVANRFVRVSGHRHYLCEEQNGRRSSQDHPTEG